MTTGKLTSFVLYAITLSVGLLGATGVINIIVTATGVSEKVKINLIYYHINKFLNFWSFNINF